MQALLKLSDGIDWISSRFALVADYLVLFCTLISAGNAIIRYLFSMSSNGWLEIQWYMFGAIVLLGASHTLRMNEHVRVDLIYGAVSDRARLWIDTVGIVLFLLPVCIYFSWVSWPFFLDAFRNGEMSQNPGGLIRWPAKLMLVAGFGLLGLQGLSELIKRVAALAGVVKLDTTYEKPLQ